MTDTPPKSQTEDNHNSRDKSHKGNIGVRCTVWISQMPPSTTYTNLFRSIRNAAPIIKCKLLPPNPIYPNHSGAIIRFSQEAGALNLEAQAQAKTFIINGAYPKVERLLAAEKLSHLTDGRSRGLRIKGPGSIVNRQVLECIWRERFRWETDSSRDLGLGEYASQRPIFPISRNV